MTIEYDNADLQDFAELIIRSSRGPIRVNQPGTVVSYDPETQTASVQPVLRVLIVDREAEEEQWVRPRPVEGVPVVFPSGGGHITTWPLAPGDPVTLLFCDRDASSWRSSGAADAQPTSRQRFSPADLFAVPGGRAPADPMPAGSTDGTSRVVWATKTLFRFANTATKALAIAEGVRDRLNAIENLVNSHKHLVPSLDVYAGASVIGTTDPLGTTAVIGTAGTTTLADLATNRIEVDE